MKRYKGEGVAAGIALGKVWLQGYEEAEGFAPRIPTDRVESELARLQQAVDLGRSQIEDLKNKHEGQLGAEELRIFDTHILYLQDSTFLGELGRLIRDERFALRAAIKKVVADYERIFQLVENEYLRLRAGDFRDVATRVLRNLDQDRPEAHSAPEGRYILAARRLTTTDMFGFDNEQVLGIVAEEGGISSHAAILARSMGIPTVTGIVDLPAKLANGDFAVVDGDTGELVVAPDEPTSADYAQRAERQHVAHLQLSPSERLHSTRDGRKVRIMGSCGNVGEVGLARSFGMDGVGLFRTELAFLIDKKLPSEDALTQLYREVAREPGDLPVYFRLLDVGSTTTVPGLPVQQERNPNMGLRGVRVLLEEGSVLRLQVRAILRAGAGAKQVGVLIPFVTTVAELTRIKSVILEERQALRKRKEPQADKLLVAPVIEVPAAGLAVKMLLDESDFLVVAIDDLQAHLMAADRDNTKVKDLYQLMHPALFELLARMARECDEQNKRLLLFGEGAADPLRVPFYLGIGVTDFSVAPVRLTGLVRILRQFTIDECRGIANQVLEAPRPVDIQRILVGLGGR